MNSSSPPIRFADRTFAADLADVERLAFIRKTYLHLTGAVLAFAGILALLLQSEWAEPIAVRMLSGRSSWLIVMVLFMAVSWVAEKWARSATSPGVQYAGLGLFVVAEAIIFYPLCLIASRLDPSVLSTAGVLTLVLFGGLSIIVLTTRKDFSFLRSALVLGGFAALGVILCGILFGFTLGLGFTLAMLVLASGYVLYDTSNMLHHYRVHQHVAAALGLFATMALMFWYMIRLVMALKNR